MGVVENLIKVFQGCLVQLCWKVLEVHGKITKGRNDWKGGIEVLKVVIILTEVLIQVKGEEMPTVEMGGIEKVAPRVEGQMGED